MNQSLRTICATALLLVCPWCVALDNADPSTNRTDLQIARVRSCVDGSRQNGENVKDAIDRCMAVIEPSPAEKAEIAAWDKLEKDYAAKVAAQRKAAAEWAARPKSVHIGMTDKEVRKTQWGKPERINSSTGRYGTHEQWVFGSGQYLYFENGVLTTIQQSK